MSLSIILICLGLLAGLSRGGKLSKLSSVKFRLPFLVIMGIAIQVLAQVYAALSPAGLDRRTATLAFAASYVSLIAFALANLRLAGIWLIGVGLAMNLAVIFLNEGMPVSRRAASAAGVDLSNSLQGALKHRPMDEQTRLGFLGDVIPLPGLKQVASAGDAVLGLGMFRLISRLIRYSPRRRRAKSDLFSETLLRD